MFICTYGNQYFRGFLLIIVKEICSIYKLNAENIVEEWMAFSANDIELSLESLEKLKSKVYYSMLLSEIHNCYAPEVKKSFSIE